MNDEREGEVKKWAGVPVPLANNAPISALYDNFKYNEATVSLEGMPSCPWEQLPAEKRNYDTTVSNQVTGNT